MKLLVLSPALLTLVFISNSCGTSPKQEKPVDVQPFVYVQEEVFQTGLDEIEQVSSTAIPVNSAIPVANLVAGRPGFVFNPYNQNMVEVKGISSGTKVRDPQDADPSHIFVVP